MKRFLSIILTVIMIATSVMCVSVFAADEIKVTINGEEKAFDVTPVIINDRTLVPMRGIFEAFGATVEWDGATQSVTASVSSSKIVLQVGKVVAMVNGQYVDLDAPARLIEGRTMVPVRFIAETLGCEVNWVDATRTVVIKGDVKAPETPSTGTGDSAGTTGGNAFVPVDDGWADIAVVGFEGGNPAPSSGLNFWGTKPAGGNANTKFAYVSYSDAGVSKPSSSEDFGSGILAIDISKGEGADASKGIVAGRINDIPADTVPFKAGEKYKVSLWAYNAGEGKAKITMSVYSGKNSDGFKKSSTAEINKGEWKRIEVEIEAKSENEGQVTGARFTFSNTSLMYIDNLSFEKPGTGGGSAPAPSTPSTPAVSQTVSDAKLPSGGKVIVTHADLATMADGKNIKDANGVLTITAKKSEKDTALTGTSKKALNGMFTKGNVYMATFKARLVSGAPYAKLFIQAGKDGGFSKPVFACTSYGSDWTTCYMPFVGIDKDMEAFGFRFAGETHTTEIKDFQIIDYGTSVKIADLPHTYIVVGNTAVNGIKLQ